MKPMATRTPKNRGAIFYLRQKIAELKALKEKLEKELRIQRAWNDLRDAQLRKQRQL